MPRIAFPYVLTLAVSLFVIGIYGALSRTSRGGVAGGIFLMLSGVGVGVVGFVSFLPGYYVKPWLGYGAILLVLGAMVEYGRRIMNSER